METPNPERRGLRKGVYLIPSAFTAANIGMGFYAVMAAVRAFQFVGAGSEGDLVQASVYLDNAATTPVDADTVVQIMEVVRRFWPQLQPSRAAILTRHDEDPAALVAHALADEERLPMRAFNSLDEAMAWLREGE